jgi:hypothetical protein
MPTKNNQIQTDSNKNNELEPCYGCGAQVQKSDGSTHGYIGASPGCWAVFGEVLAKEYEEFNYPPVHRLTVDAYAAQHPGKPSRQTIQSVAVHLIGLHLMLDLIHDADWATKTISKVVQNSQDFHWLEPPSSLGGMTILDVYGTENLKDHTDHVYNWVHAVWHAWQPHHAQIHAWANWDQ